MEESKSKFRLLYVTEKMIDYVNDILPNYPKKRSSTKTEYRKKPI